MVDRVIKFSHDALHTSGVYEAMVKDNVARFEKTGPAGAFVYVHDSIADDFPNLRVALRAGRFSYDFHQRRAGDGDHAGWYHSRNGTDETYSNFGLSDEPVPPLFD